MIDTILCDVLKTNVKSENSVALLLSGGVDSISIAFSLHRLEIGIKIHAYSFRLDTQDNYDFRLVTSYSYDWVLLAGGLPRQLRSQFVLPW